MIICAEPFTGRRLRVRRIDEAAFARRMANLAIERGDWVFEVEHGGSVCNSYGYRADTECVLAVSDPFGNVVYWTGRAPANKVTNRSAANACFPHAAVLFDGRVTSKTVKEEARRILMAEHGKFCPAMLTIAVAASA